MVVINGSNRSSILTSELLCEEPLVYAISGDNVYLEVLLELGVESPYTQHRLSISDGSSTLFETRFYSKSPEGLLQLVLSSIVNGNVRVENLVDFAYWFGGTCADRPNLTHPTLPKKLSN